MDIDDLKRVRGIVKMYTDKGFGAMWFNLVSVSKDLKNSDNQNIVRLQQDLERLANEFEATRIAIIEELTKDIESHG